MRLLFHGGKCCGIKTLYDFGFDGPDALVGAVEAKKETNKDEYGHDVSSEEDFFTDEAPKETKLARMDRLIAFCKRRRPAGIIEATLATSYYLEYDQVSQGWPELLKERDFKLVNMNVNSNSENTVHVYHLNYNEMDEDD
jgi:hypothetical protein